MLPHQETIRSLFPGTGDKAFLDAACVSLAPTVASEAITGFLREAVYCPAPSATAQHLAMDAARETARQQAAQLINASTDEIAIVESTTAGLNAIAAALPLAAGDNVLLCDLEFPQVTIPFVHLRQTRQIEIRPVYHRHGLVTVDDFARACDRRTKAIVVSAVQWAHGLKLDLAGLSELAAQHNAWLIVDAIQQLGASVLDAARLGIDALACGGHKWLNAPFGCGFLYVNKKRLSEVEPVMRGYLTMREPAGGWDAYFSTSAITPLRDYSYVDDARKFETGGTANYPGAVGLGASLQLLNQVGPAAIEAHIRELSRELIEGLQRRGLRLVTPHDDARRAGIVTFSAFAEPARDQQLAEFLLRHKVYISTRYTAHIGGLRTSVHFFNNRDDVERLFAALDAFHSAIRHA